MTAPAAARPGAPTVAAELLLLTTTLAALAGFTRVFDDRVALAPLVVAAVAAHLGAAALRRAHQGALVSFGAMSGLALLQVSATLYPHLSRHRLPSPEVVEVARTDLLAAWDLFGDVVAPAPVERGFLLAVTLATWVAVGLADWAAFRLHTVVEAVLPALALFVMTCVLGTGPGGVLLAGALAASTFAFAAALRASRAAEREVWVGSARRGSRAALGAGLLLALAASVSAALVVPGAPGADGAALVDWRRGDQPGGRVTVSPLVDIRSRLVQQSDTEVFTVEADRPAYWRLTSLPRFDGQVWSSSDRFSEADGRLPGDEVDTTSTRLVQTYTIEALDSIWAPAALTPVELLESDGPLRWNGELATLIVPSSTPDVDGLRYTVVSAVPDLAPEDLRAPLPTELDEDLAEATSVPAALPAEVGRLAREVTAGTDAQPYALARRLQDWFRSEFTYSLDDVQGGHDTTAIEAFLTRRRGYCEQFAGTFAAMARTLGLPARVAVGFTPGEPDAGGRRYTVRGRNAHAWPEVHIPGAGWVPFEPTPGRGQPGAEAYTGVAPAQDTTDPVPTTTTTAPPTTSGPSTTAAPGATEDRSTPSATPATPGTGGGGADTAPAPTPRPLSLVALLVVLVALDAAVVALVRRRRRRRAAAARAPAAVVAGAWRQVLDAARVRGVVPHLDETDEELGRRLVAVAGPGAAKVAELVTRATWGEVDAAGADAARRAGAEAVARLRAGRSRRQRLAERLDPRLLGRGEPAALLLVAAEPLPDPVGGPADTVPEAPLPQR